MTIQTLVEMPKDELRAMIAGFDGFSEIEVCPFHGGIDGIKNGRPEDVPDYPNSLHAMAAIEAGLADGEYVKWSHCLAELCAKDNAGKSFILRTASASAHHRAVAYVAIKLKL